MQGVFCGGAGLGLFAAGFLVPICVWLNGMLLGGDAKELLVLVQLAGFGVLLGGRLAGRPALAATAMLTGPIVLLAAVLLPLCAPALGMPVDGEMRAFFCWMQIMGFCLGCWAAAAAPPVPPWVVIFLRGCALTMIAGAGACALVRDSETQALLMWSAMLGMMVLAASFACRTLSEPAPVMARG